MAVSVEAYWLVNFAMDLLATAIIARSLGRVRWKRVALAAAVGASWAALAQLGALRFLGSLPALAALSLLMAAIAIPPDSLRTALVSGAALLGGGVFLGGVQLAALRLFRGAGAAAFFAGALLGAGGIWVGDTDDAPGAAFLGLVLMAALFLYSCRLLRRPRKKYYPLSQAHRTIPSQISRNPHS